MFFGLEISDSAKLNTITENSSDKTTKNTLDFLPKTGYSNIAIFCNAGVCFGCFQSFSFWVFRSLYSAFDAVFHL